MALDKEDALVIALDEEEAHDGPRLRRGLTASRRQQVLANSGDSRDHGVIRSKYYKVAWDVPTSTFLSSCSLSRML